LTILRHVIRFIVSAIVLLVVGFLVPGFAVDSFWTALIAALMIAALGWVIEAIFGNKLSPYNRGIIGFLVSAGVIYLTQFLVEGMRVTLLGALLAALVIGVIDLFIPVRSKFGTQENQGDNRQRT